MSKNLYLIGSFVTGFSLMTVELLASRIVAPIIGSSVFTWTSVIGTTLLGLSIGSYIGGKIADKYNDNRPLPISFLVSGVAVFLISFFAQNVSFIINSTNSILLINLFVSLYLFLPSALLIGTIQPIILKKYADNMTKIGKEYGVLSALWSLGSILGVFMSGFYFVSHMGSLETIRLTSITLLLLGLIFSYKNKKILSIITIFFIIFCIISFIIPEKSVKNKNLLFEKETNYYKIRIADRNLPQYGDTRFLFLDIDSHNEVAKNVGIDSYTKIYPIFSEINKNLDKILIIGAGAYELPQYFKKSYKNSEVTVVEVDPEIEKVGGLYFGLKTSDIKTKVTDARIFISKTDEKYDLIFGDAYNSFISVPWYLLTTEFNAQIYERLTENGIYVLNFIGKIEGKGSELAKSIITTLNKTFKNEIVLGFNSSYSSIQNIVVIGIKGDIDMQTIVKNISKNYPYFAKKILNNTDLEKLTHSENILTDNFSPTEKLMKPITEEYFADYIRFIQKISI